MAKQYWAENRSWLGNIELIVKKSWDEEQSASRVVVLRKYKLFENVWGHSSVDRQIWGQFPNIVKYGRFQQHQRGFHVCRRRKAFRSFVLRIHISPYKHCNKICTRKAKWSKYFCDSWFNNQYAFSFFIGDGSVECAGTEIGTVPLHLAQLHFWQICIKVKSNIINRKKTQEYAWKSRAISSIGRKDTNTYEGESSA